MIIKQNTRIYGKKPQQLVFEEVSFSMVLDVFCEITLRMTIVTVTVIFQSSDNSPKPYKKWIKVKQESGTGQGKARGHPQGDRSSAVEPSIRKPDLNMPLIDWNIQQIQEKKGGMSFSSYELQDLSESQHRRPYHRTQLQEKNDLIREVIENGLTISKAARKLKINNSTAKVIIRKYKQAQPKARKTEESREASIENSTVQSKAEPTVPEVHRFTPPLYILYDPSIGYPQPFNLCYNMLWTVYPNGPHQ